MELTKVFQAMTDYASTYSSASEAFQQTKKKLREDYGNGKVFDQKFSEAKNLYDSTLAAAKQKGLGIGLFWHSCGMKYVLAQ